MLRIVSNFNGFFIFIICLMIAMSIFYSKPDLPVAEVPEKPEIRVLVNTVENIDRPLVITTQGNVKPKRQTQLTSRVSGTIVDVNDKFIVGGQFKKGEFLLQIEDIDYQNALVTAELNLSRAEESLAIEKATARDARNQWVDLGDAEANDLFLRKPQLKRAEAEVDAAKHNLDIAKLNLKRTKIIAPFDGRIIDVSVNIGQFIGNMSPLATIYESNDYLVIAPLTNLQIKSLQLIGNQERPLDTKVIIKNSDGINKELDSQLVHVNSTMSSNSRLIDTVIATTSDDLLPGMFVDVVIYSDYSIPQYELTKKALYLQNKVFVVIDDILQLQTVNILNNLLDTVVVSGLADGTEVVVQRPLWSNVDDPVTIMR